MTVTGRAALILDEIGPLEIVDLGYEHEAKKKAEPFYRQLEKRGRWRSGDLHSV